MATLRGHHLKPLESASKAKPSRAIAMPAVTRRTQSADNAQAPTQRHPSTRCRICMASLSTRCRTATRAALVLALRVHMAGRSPDGPLLALGDFALGAPAKPDPLGIEPVPWSACPPNGHLAQHCSDHSPLTLQPQVRPLGRDVVYAVHEIVQPELQGCHLLRRREVVDHNFHRPHSSLNSHTPYDGYDRRPPPPRSRQAPTVSCTTSQKPRPNGGLFEASGRAQAPRCPVSPGGERLPGR